MERRHQRSRGVGLLCAVIGLAGGCGSVPALPDTFEVATTADLRVEVDAGTGPIGFADSTWSIARVADPNDPEEVADEPIPPGPYGGLLNGQGLARPPVGERIFLVQFGSQGQMVEVTENRYFLAEIYGATIPIGGDWTAATLPGVQFRSDSYGTQTGDRFGLAEIVNVRFGNLFLGQAVLYAWGTQTGDQIAGTFGYVIDFTEGAVPTLSIVADQYPIEGERID